MAEELRPFPAEFDRVLAVVAHPDDVEWGMAAAIAGWTAAGRHVRYLLATRGEAGIDALPPAEAGPLREREQIAAALRINVAGVEFLNHADGAIEDGQALRRDIVRALRRHRPDLVLTLNHDYTWGRDAEGRGSWNSPDHRAVGRATLDAAGAAGNRWIFPELAAEGLQPWTGIRRVGVVGSPRPTHAIDVTDGVEAGIASLREHRSYLAGLSDEPVEDQARAVYENVTRRDLPGFEGRRMLTLELAIG
ncbi:PIG-L deacetylase family protein [Kineococcus gynurae]|uniref:PIG-L deacetylase family protein n=1 Tax=Kineococcus gynurae TaxID=452979 RepID=A0ABV5LSM5_9ACTN